MRTKFARPGVRRGLAALALAATAAALPAQGAPIDSNATAWSLSGGGKTLVTIAGRGAGSAVDIDFGKGVKDQLVDIDYRPATGGLFGYSDRTDTVYSIDILTGKATAVVRAAGTTSTAKAGFDFNNVVDRARVVTTQEENAVFDPNVIPPTLVRVTNLFYAAGDVNAGKNPNVFLNAYTNAVKGAATTVQFVIDTGLDVLATLANNAGTLTTVGKLMLDGKAFDAGDKGGFDILSFAEGDNSAFAILTRGNKQGLYSFSLTPDAAGNVNLSLVTDLSRSYKDGLTGFTVAPAPAPVPLPASALLLGAGLGLAGVVARRRRRTA
jgi:hypothetical protein